MYLSFVDTAFFFVGQYFKLDFKKVMDWMFLFETIILKGIMVWQV